MQRRIRDLAPGGGYVLASVHNIQEDVPPENILAMVDEALEYRSDHSGGRPIAVNDLTFAYAEELSGREYIIATYYLETDSECGYCRQGGLLCRRAERGHLGAGAGHHPRDAGAAHGPHRGHL